MRIFCWNVNALVPTIPNFRLTHGSLKGFFDSQQADVVCFQETKLQSEEKLTAELACVEDFESFWTFSRDKKGYSGVATYVAKQFSPVSAQVDCLGSDGEDINREGRCVVTDLGAFVLINVYVPNAGDRKAGDGERVAFKVRFLEALKQKADVLRDGGREVIIVGDLNVAASQADVHKKLKYETMYSRAEKEALQALLRDYTDVWRQLHPDVDSTFTVWAEKTSARVFNEGLRIDYALLSPGLLERVVSCEVVANLPPKWSDHAALALELRDIPEAPPHVPCALSSARMKRFAKPKTSIASMFAKRLAANTGTAAGAQPAAKKAKIEPAAAAAAEMRSDAAVDPSVPSREVPHAAAADRLAGDEQKQGEHDSAPAASAPLSLGRAPQPGLDDSARERAGADGKQAMAGCEDLKGLSQNKAGAACQSQQLPPDTETEQSKAASTVAGDQARKQGVPKTQSMDSGSLAKAEGGSKSSTAAGPKQKSIRGFFSPQQ